MEVQNLQRNQNVVKLFCGGTAIGFAGARHGSAAPVQAVKYLMVTSNACFVCFALLRLNPVPLYGEPEAVELETCCPCNVLFITVPKLCPFATGHATLDRGFVAGALALKLRPIGVCTTRVLVNGDSCAHQKGCCITWHLGNTRRVLLTSCTQQQRRLARTSYSGMLALIGTKGQPRRRLLPRSRKLSYTPKCLPKEAVRALLTYVQRPDCR